MNFPKYYVNQDGIIHSVFAETGNSTCQNNYLIVDSLNGYLEIQILLKEEDECLIDEEFVLWDSLKGLAVAIEGE